VIPHLAGDDLPAQAVKSCCAKFYASDAARFLLGDSFHPGGRRLTERLGHALHLGPADRVLDVACGDGRGALVLAQTFGCSVMGIDYSEANIRRAAQAALAAGMDRRIVFCCGDGEGLPFAVESFSAVVCECAFCTFPDKHGGAREMRRVLAPGGRLGLSDVTLERPLPPELGSLVAWVLCIADARRPEDYRAILGEAGFAEFRQSDHAWALREIVAAVGRRLMGIELAQGLGALPGMEWDLEAAKAVTRQAAQFVEAGGAGYILLSAAVPAAPRFRRR